MSELQETETLALLNDFRKVMHSALLLERGITGKTERTAFRFYLPCRVSAVFPLFWRLFSTRREMPYITQKGGTM